jgi:hypothetical protein
VRWLERHLIFLEMAEKAFNIPGAVQKTAYRVKPIRRGGRGVPVKIN